MPWSSTRPNGKATDAKYQSREHRELRGHYVRLIRDGHLVECAAVVCVMGDRAIVNTNGLQADGLNLGHNDDGVTYRGPEHRACNVRDGAVRGNARSQGEAPRRWVI